jgi:hypothetical protein
MYHAFGKVPPLETEHFQYDPLYRRLIALTSYFGVNALLWCLPGLVWNLFRSKASVSERRET